jgi:hypothetical protein
MLAWVMWEWGNEESLLKPRTAPWRRREWVVYAAPLCASDSNALVGSVGGCGTVFFAQPSSEIIMRRWAPALVRGRI